jgi:hypothetical protein
LVFMGALLPSVMSFVWLIFFLPTLALVAMGQSAGLQIRLGLHGCSPFLRDVVGLA